MPDARLIGFALYAIAIAAFLLWAGLYLLPKSEVAPLPRSEHASGPTYSGEECTRLLLQAPLQYLLKVFAAGSGNNQKVRFDLTITGPSEARDEHFIVKSGWFYRWRSWDPSWDNRPIKMPIKYSEDFRKYFIDREDNDLSHRNLVCETAEINQSIFDLPANIDFTPDIPTPASSAIPAPAGSVDRIQQLKRFAQEHSGIYDQDLWSAHNELRHLYSTQTPPDMWRAMEQTDFILQHWIMDNYMLHILSGWQMDNDPFAARARLIENAKAYPEFRFITAASFLKVGDLYAKEGDDEYAKDFYNLVFLDTDTSADMEHYRLLARKRLAAL